MLSRSLTGAAREGFELTGGLEDLWHRLGELQLQGEKEFWCIGGAEIYQLLLPYTGEAYITRVKGTYGADAFLPVLEGFALKEQATGEGCLFERYVREKYIW